MKVIVKPRQCGKSTDAIKYAHKYDYHILTFNEKNATKLYFMAKEMGYEMDRRRFLSAKIGPSVLKSKFIKGLVIDNVDMVLSSLLNLCEPIMMMTISGVNECEYDERRDSIQYQEFRSINPDLTFAEFSKFKYGSKYDWEK